MRNLFDNPILLLVLVLLVVVVFGAKRLPDAARSLGRSMRIFKTEVKEMKEDGKDTAAPGGPGAPLEGRVIDGSRHDAPSASSAGREQHDQQRSA
jgi:sec-independent protein translocase protein TatA